MSCVFNSTECNTRGEAGVPHPSKPDEIVYGLCTCPGVSYRYGVCTGIPEAYLPSFEEFYRNMTGESLTLASSQPGSPLAMENLNPSLDVFPLEELMDVSTGVIKCSITDIYNAEETVRQLQRSERSHTLGTAINNMHAALKALQEMKDSLSEKD